MKYGSYHNKQLEQKIWKLERWYHNRCPDCKLWRPHTEIVNVIGVPGDRTGDVVCKECGRYIRMWDPN